MFNRNQPEESKSESAIVLPKALFDCRSMETWPEIREILFRARDVKRHPAFLEVPKELLCPITESLMYKPVQITYDRIKVVLEHDSFKFFKRATKELRERKLPATEENLQKVYKKRAFPNDLIDFIIFLIEKYHVRLEGLQVLPDHEVKQQIDQLICENPHLKKVQWIPKIFLEQMYVACSGGDVNTIKNLANKNDRILFIRHLETKLSPLCRALRNEESFSCLIDMYEGIQPGLALAVLLELDEEQFPLERSIYLGNSIILTLKIMAWMGDSLDLVMLKDFPQKLQRLNELLLVSVMHGQLEWAKKLISWGADLSSYMPNSTNVLKVAIQLADPCVKEALYNFAVESGIKDRLQISAVIKPLSMDSYVFTQLRAYYSIEMMLTALANKGINFLIPLSEMRKFQPTQKDKSAMQHLPFFEKKGKYKKRQQIGSPRQLECLSLNKRNSSITKQQKKTSPTFFVRESGDEITRFQEAVYEQSLDRIGKMLHANSKLIFRECLSVAYSQHTFNILQYALLQKDQYFLDFVIDCMPTSKWNHLLLATQKLQAMTGMKNSRRP